MQHVSLLNTGIQDQQAAREKVLIFLHFAPCKAFSLQIFNHSVS